LKPLALEPQNYDFFPRPGHGSSLLAIVNL
jgi:hypothetical protein